MHGEHAIKIEGTVVEMLPGKTKNLYRVALANGHRVLGFPRGRANRFLRLQPGEKVILEMSPADFSKGRIAVMEQQA